MKEERVEAEKELQVGVGCPLRGAACGVRGVGRTCEYSRNVTVANNTKKTTLHCKQEQQMESARMDEEIRVAEELGVQQEAEIEDMAAKRKVLEHDFLALDAERNAVQRKVGRVGVGPQPNPKPNPNANPQPQP